jgi:hypothetical protein
MPKDIKSKQEISTYSKLSQTISKPGDIELRIQRSVVRIHSGIPPKNLVIATLHGVLYFSECQQKLYLDFLEIHQKT